ncbi:hypothetical protein K7X08_017567 [Anisodus acutangulus]|uniref:Uncharacterized protein n=1 Tax=Anisodus acutangulus TaxID=402998 RepID=A0A9Q1LXJ9_9SOLA|nr:hypothetical protein K7X08_017567 [Anisodus acutangulus]
MGRTIILANQKHHHLREQQPERLVSSNPSSPFHVFPSLGLDCIQIRNHSPNSQKFNLYLFIVTTKNQLNVILGDAFHLGVSKKSCPDLNIFLS